MRTPSRYQIGKSRLGTIEPHRASEMFMDSLVRGHFRPEVMVPIVAISIFSNSCSPCAAPALSAWRG